MDTIVPKEDQPVKSVPVERQNAHWILAFFLRTHPQAYQKCHPCP
jgi:hypothetical protein